MKPDQSSIEAANVKKHGVGGKTFRAAIDAAMAPTPPTPERE